MFKAKLHQLVNKRLAKIVALSGVSNELAECIKQADLRPAPGFHRENITVDDRHFTQGIIKQLGEIILVLPCKQTQNQVFRAQIRRAFGESHGQHFIIVNVETSDVLFPVLRLGGGFIGFFQLIRQLVAQKFVQEHLRDDLKFIAVITQPVSSTDFFRLPISSVVLFLKSRATKGLLRSMGNSGKNIQITPSFPVSNPQYARIHGCD